ncbi:unnamed protein product [Bursaphelenchus xylophilus]|uniref:(pine wood nematode) hypothetical protein n=1 Tax=Bursaphelenchus xylophilus TaxID=6326 RepID=A0A1I7S6B9_BURXY|nr:unnamed protein product [Bursaphelenchus xylophilus]CAG9128159.1 unnamed protein product [Bursaphelenchus xylophilus]
MRKPCVLLIIAIFTDLIYSQDLEASPKCFVCSKGKDEDLNELMDNFNVHLGSNIRNVAFKQRSENCGGGKEAPQELLVSCSTSCAIATIHNITEETVIAGCAAKKITREESIVDTYVSRIYILEMCTTDGCNDLVRGLANLFRPANLVILTGIFILTGF